MQYTHSKVRVWITGVHFKRPRRKFILSALPLNSGMELNYVYFSTSGFRYIIYDNYFSESDEYCTGIRIVNQETEKAVNVKGDYDTRQGKLVNLRESERIIPGEELFD